MSLSFPATAWRQALIAALAAVKTAGMAEGRESNWSAQLAAAEAWWREAGVDLVFRDEPRSWLASAAPQPALPQAPIPAARGTVAKTEAPTRIGGEPGAWPQRLEEFADWWLVEPSLDVGGGRRVPPVGPPAPDLMIVVPMPEAADREALLSGPQGRLLNAILRAFGTSREHVYIASALPRSLPAPDWPNLVAGGLGDVLAHHVRLVAPKRLVAFGRDVSPLLGHDPAQPAPLSLALNQEGASVPLAIMPSLDALIARPGLKRTVWARWLEWTES